MKVWSSFDPSTGEIASRTYSGPDGWTPVEHEGWELIQGEYDHLSQRVDLTTRKVIDWQPPQPSADHEWNPERRRWALRADAAARAERRAVNRVAVEELERRHLRALREATLGYDGAKARLQALDDQIIALRATL